MAEDLPKFKLLVINPDRVVFQGEVHSLFLPGDTGEFELLPYHYPVMSLLRDGDIVLDWESAIPIRHGIAKFFRNECIILAEIDEFAFIDIPGFNI
ncbi:MAG: hypothetical protein ABH858_01350 [Candidatus Omnitrophota bacterium]